MKRLISAISTFLFLAMMFSCAERDLDLDTAGKVVPGKRDTIKIDDGGNIGKMISIQEYGVLPGNSASVNKANLQSAIDEASKSGVALYVTPCENGYPCDGGIVLKRNVTLIGSHGPTGRGTRNKAGNGPTGSLFVIKDMDNPFLTVESGTAVRGIQFYYPDQTFNNGAAIKQYKPAITISQDQNVDGVTLRDLSFYGEYLPMDFRAGEGHCCSQLYFEHIYGYPLSSCFIAVDRCSHGLKIQHCHANPANMREFGRSYSKSVIDMVMKTRGYAYWIDHTDNASLMDIFTFGTYGGLYMGAESSGHLTSFNLDCVTIGVFKDGKDAARSNWEISQGSIIANTGKEYKYVHPFIVTGEGSTSLTNVNAFSGGNGALTTLGKSYDFIYITGQGAPTVTMTACSMRNYVSDNPLTIVNGRAKVRAESCNDGGNTFFTCDFKGTGEPAPEGDDGQAPDEPDEPDEPDDDEEPESGTETVFDDCESLSGWITSGEFKLSLDQSDKKAGSACLSVTGKARDQIFARRDRSCKAKVTLEKGHFKFWFYISDLSAIDFSGENATEITSSGLYDEEEICWRFNQMNLKEGWNSVDLKLSEGAAAGKLNVKNVNYFRMYSLAIKKDVTLKLDQMIFYQE